jgi:hypothetical protein
MWVTPLVNVADSGYGLDMDTTTKETTMTDVQGLLDATERFEAAQTAVRIAETRIDSFVPSAPLRDKVEATERLRAADAELAEARAAYDAAQDRLAPED